VLKGLLEKDGHAVVMADNGRDALQELEHSNFTAVFTDINLTGMSGIDIVKTIRSAMEGDKAKLPVLAITGNVGAQDVQDYRDAGFNGFVAKPIDPATLAEALHKIHRGEIQSGFHLHAGEDGVAQDIQQKTRSMQDILNDDGNTGLDASGPFMEEVEEAGKGFDMGMLERLAQTLGKVEVSALISSFLDKTDEIVSDLEGLRGSEHAEEIRDRGHELKGMAANFGSLSLSLVAGKVEKHAKERDFIRAQKAILA
jgi:CheY-like chemotaxis protein/HPt (histidine-containing phosphotransfer) domain-containing protein